MLQALLDDLIYHRSQLRAVYLACSVKKDVVLQTWTLPTSIALTKAADIPITSSTTLLAVYKSSLAVVGGDSADAAALLSF